MIAYLVLALIVGICSAIYWGFWYGTRTKIEMEDKKLEFLESKFEYLKDYKFDKETITSNSEISRILSLLNQNGFKKGTITGVDSSLPHNEKKPWKVYLTVKSGTWPFNDKEEQIEIFNMFDKELSSNEEFSNFIDIKK
jgi:hypothetical protein